MGEISDLIGIYGAIERAVISDPARRAAVAQVLPIYGDVSVEDVDEFKWFDQFEAWAKEKAGEESDESPIPALDDALKDLAHIPAEGRMRARRMLAIAALARAIPAYRDRRRTEGKLARDALQFAGITADSRKLASLHRLLTDDSQDLALSADDWWDERVLPPAAKILGERPEFIGHRPCTAGLVRVPVSVPGHGSVLATALKTEFETTAVDFDRAVRFLDPSHWPGCSGFWCEMSLVGTLPSGARHFHEVVSLDCPHKASTWSISAELAFTNNTFANPRVAATEYHLVAPHPFANDDVLVDAGVLTVEELSPPPASRLRVTTTKRVYFTKNFPGPGMSIFMCAIGYAAVAEDFVLTCAIDPTKQGSEFNPRPKKGTSQGPDQQPPLAPVIKEFADEVAATTKACLDDLATMAQETADKIDNKDYGADDLVQDAARIWVKTLREGAAAVELGIRNARVAGARARTPPED
jgi:hypothetical protein